ncbi:hemerythrin domain-containing protein [Algoriphagus persicinus]|uniref:hemerythrin domain-containing protein n=1 Tax=Algoriphagus persicinus TaxID=3108754 RepID=UPI002B3E7FE2|nr:hemerythrin domain-containing protein [Algoriphagus sp. E1-3-M2]MEB2785330.1 hemerythrin domain-containing protein [Algoriphagus sp. E1-3-M2]
MRIIDPKTGKRLLNAESEAIRQLKENDPVRKIGDKDFEQIENSPMDPPDAYSLTQPDGITGWPEILQKFQQEHQVALAKIALFEVALQEFKENGYRFDQKINATFGEFFEFFDKNILVHNLKEEKLLFPLLQDRMIESGEHSQSHPPRTGVDLLEDDHMKFVQLGALTFNFLGLGTRVPDHTSRMIVFDQAYTNGRELVELLRLHIFREENHIFPLSIKLVSADEFKKIIEMLPNLAL